MPATSREGLALDPCHREQGDAWCMVVCSGCVWAGGRAAVIAFVTKGGSVNPIMRTHAPASRRRVLALGSAFVVLALGLAVVGQVAAPQRDRTADMAMKITDPFTVATVGDLLVLRPASQWGDPGLQAALRIVRDADVSFGNMESSMSDMRNFDGPMRGWMGTKEVGADVKAMGFDLLNRANNHVFDSDQQGMFATHKLLDEAGLVHAGAGKNLQDARAARFVETPKGRVGLVGMHTPNDRPEEAMSATERFGNTGGRPGVNPLHLRPSLVVTPQQFIALKSIRDAIYERRGEYADAVPLPPSEPGDRLELFGTTNGGPRTVDFKKGEKAGVVSYDMNQEDLRGILRSIRNGKEYSDLMIATIHAHQNDSVLQQHGDHPPDFLIELAHKTIDNGADVFVGHGPHLLRGIEIYKGKPIFYDLGEFFCQMHWAPQDANAYRGRKLDPLTTEVTDAEIADTHGNLAVAGFPVNYESVVAVSRLEASRLTEVRLHPIELRYDGPLARWGIPRTAPPEVGRRILERLQGLSKPFGTTIAIEGNIGVIKVAAGRTQ